MRKRSKIKLNKEEEELLTSFEKDEWKSSKQIKEEKTSAKTAATNFLNKNA